MNQFRYPDKWFRLIGIPLLGFVVLNFGMYEPLYEALKTRQYYLDLAYDIFIVWVVWETNRRIIMYLDQRYSWITRRMERLFLQVFLIFTISCVEVIGLVYLLNEVLIQRKGYFDIGWLMVMDIPMVMVFTLIINLMYTGMYLIHYHQVTVTELQDQLEDAYEQISALHAQKTENRPAEAPHKQLIVNFGNSSIPITTDRIGHIYKANELCLIKTFDNKEFTSASSLENLEAILSQDNFFRLNRQVLANVQAIKQFKPHTSGKLLVELEPALTEEVFVSKKRAPEFKEWLGKKV